MDHQSMPNHSIAIIPDSSSPLYPKHTTPSSTNHLTRNNNPSSDQPTSSTTRKSISIGRMFFKTKLHSMLRSGTRPNVGNCSFAHREEYQIPILTSSDWERSYKGKQCKKFYTDEGCPYGDMCSFLHDEKSKDRESVVIKLSPNVGAGGNGCIQKHYWKSRICNKWEMTGYCPFGTKYHFAHGAEELHSHGGRVAEMETNNTSSTVPDASIKAAITAVSSTTLLPC